MRPKIVIPVLAAGLLAVALVLCYRPRAGGPADGQAQEEATAQATGDAATTNTGPRAARPGQATAKPSDGPAAAVADQASPGMEAGTPEEQHKAYVEARVSELQDLSANDDKESLQTILSELNNRDPEVRKASVEAAKQFGSRDAIPNLQDAMTQTDDPVEKAEINEAIEFLKLPNLSEVMKPGGTK